MAHLVLRDQWVYLELEDQRERRAVTDHLDHLVHLVPLALLEKA